MELTTELGKAAVCGGGQSTQKTMGFNDLQVEFLWFPFIEPTYFGVIIAE